MPADIDPNADPNHPARCPLRLLGKGARCRALVLAGDADEHEEWHHQLDDLLSQPVEVSGGSFDVVEWPEHADVPATPRAGL